MFNKNMKRAVIQVYYLPKIERWAYLLYLYETENQIVPEIYSDGKTWTFKVTAVMESEFKCKSLGYDNFSHLDIK